MKGQLLNGFCFGLVDVMKITDVRIGESFSGRLSYQWGDAINEIPRDVTLGYCEVLTDEGITGVAPASPNELMKFLIEQVLKPLVLGEDPFETEKLWERMYWQTFNYGRKGIAIGAISILDIAIWDLIGKCVKKPLWKLLGGYRQVVPAYASEINLRLSQSELVKQCSTFVGDGFKAMKIKVGKRDWKEDLRRVGAVRDAIGYDIDLMVDANNAWGVSTAKRMARKLESYEIYWLEEPIMADNISGLAEVAAVTEIPIAVGESEYTKHGFKELIERKAVDIVQADATKVGGITEWRKVAVLAEAFGLPVAPHGFDQVHAPLVAPLPNGLIVEYIQSFTECWPLIDPIRPKDGYMQLTDKPGLGFNIDKKAIKESQEQRHKETKPYYGMKTKRGWMWPPYA